MLVRNQLRRAKRASKKQNPIRKQKTLQRIVHHRSRPNLNRKSREARNPHASDHRPSTSLNRTTRNSRAISIWITAREKYVGFFCRVTRRFGRSFVPG